MATSKKKKTKKKKANNNYTRLYNEIVGLVFLFVGIFSFYALIVKDAGTVGNALNYGIKFIFGNGGYLISISLLIMSLYIFTKKEPIKVSYKILALLVLIINYCIYQNIFNINNLVNSIFDFNIIKIALENIGENIGGGIIGLFFSSILIKLFSESGSIIILILTTIISLLIITEKSILNLFTLLFSQLKNKKKIKDSNKMNKKLSKNNIDKEITQLNKKIKILDYSEIRKNGTQIKENIEEKDKKVSSKEKIQKQKIDKQLSKLDEKIKDGPYIEEKEYAPYKFPPIHLLDISKDINNSNNRRHALHNANKLEKTLLDFGVRAKVNEISMGPTVTRYELQPEPGVKVSKIVNLSNDLALSLATSDIRIEAPIPGKAAVGIEVPNENTAIVNIREILESSKFKNHLSKITFALGKKLSGSVVVGDISKMPHMLIAGATGSGKSVCINSIITSILYKSTPDEVKLILIDPKMVELNNYNGIPHLLIPVVTDPKQASNALNWAIKEMSERYKLFKETSVRDITRYNEVMESKGKRKMPKILIIIDELADLMMVSPHEVENAICRLAQLARAAGIHLVLATQRPSVDVITGLIKANIPSRISFAVSSQIDSRTILDMGGAEKLLGRGDMLYYPVGESKPMRIQGTFISDKEVERIVNFVKNQSKADYNTKVISHIEKGIQSSNNEFNDKLMPKAIELIFDYNQASTSMLQRKLRIGYARAGRIIDEMEEKGLISRSEGSKPRKLLISREEYLEQINEKIDEE